MLKLEKIYKDYSVSGKAFNALKGIDLEFRKSEFVSILGPSGSGKTTLLNLIGGLDKYTKGDLLINDRSTKNFSDKDWDSYRNYNVGFIFQNYNLIGHLNITQNVELALSLAGISKSERNKRAKKALIEVGLEPELGKKPNQLSGGQMQRVAIARALVNDPDILLADEPTGALDTTTSVQIMDLIKKISKDRLVIMVTHNPELANEYSNRIINLLDGEVVGDNNPYKKPKSEKVVALKNKGTSMSFFTALGLSFRNLMTKKRKTLVTAFAGSIGIIGVALVLALSNGFNTYIDKTQTDTLSGTPLVVTEETSAFNFNFGSGNQGEDLEEFPDESSIIVEKTDTETAAHKNVITDEYVLFVKAIDSSLSYDINYSTGIDIDRNIYTTKTFGGMQVNQSLYGTSGNNYISEMPDNVDFISSQYDLLAGSMPTDKTDLLLVVDTTNEISDSALISLGFDGTADSFTFDDILNKTYYYFSNDDLYIENAGLFNVNNALTDTETMESGLALNISGIVRLNEQTDTGALSTGLVYTKSLTDFVLNDNLNSDISEAFNLNPTINPNTGVQFVDITMQMGASITTTSAEEQSESFGASIGASNHVRSISIYAVDFDSKNEIKESLDSYNVGLSEDNQITYDDTLESLMSTMSQLINIITYVLVAFSAISLVVSSVMIGVITYSSVVERTKEIGILRSVGARKKDISRVFNAETFIIGLISGLLGVGITYLLSIPINLVLNNLVPNIGNISNLAINTAGILILISVVLSLLAGLIPARIAANKDPVTSLRSE